MKRELKGKELKCRKYICNNKNLILNQRRGVTRKKNQAIGKKALNEEKLDAEIATRVTPFYEARGRITRKGEKKDEMRQKTKKGTPQKRCRDGFKSSLNIKKKKQERNVTRKC